MKYILQTLIGIVLLFFLSQNAICETMATVDAGRGDVSLYIPNSYDSEKPLPLIVALHGFTGSSESIKKYWRMNRLVDEKQFIFCIPDGTKNTRDQRFWNATKACCDFETGAVDDSGYLRSLIELIEKKYAVDPKSIHFLGHSNGGFMSLRMACEHADKIASVQSLAGAMFYKYTAQRIKSSNTMEVFFDLGSDIQVREKQSKCGRSLMHVHKFLSSLAHLI